MQLTRLRLRNWRNFRAVDVALQRRMFLLGPNASGKSNLLDAIRFLRDVADPQGGLARAVAHPSRQSVSQIRSLHARAQPNVEVGLELELDGDDQPWTYHLSFGQDNQRRPIVKGEQVIHGGAVFLNRPDDDDFADQGRLYQTHLEQVSLNKAFRQLAEALAQIRYLHLVPQLVRQPEVVVRRAGDPWGSDFLEQIARTPAKTRESRLRRITAALAVAVPQLRELSLHIDERGTPHLRGRYAHWRPNAGWQTEEQFSDGTLRLLGLLWAFLDGKAPLLLEEPELSLHLGVVTHIPQMLATATRRSGRQVILSTHSRELLEDEGIDGSEVLVLQPADEGTAVTLGSEDPECRDLLEAGLTVGEVIVPITAPKEARQLSLFEM